MLRAERMKSLPRIVKEPEKEQDIKPYDFFAGFRIDNRLNSEEEEDDGEEEEAEEELVEIEDGEVALAAGAVAEKVWWSWIPFIAAAASITDGYRRSRKNKKE